MTNEIKKYFLLLLLINTIACKNKESKLIEQEKIIKKDTVANSNPETTSNRYAPVDVSPMDISYYPADYPKLKMSKAINAVPFVRVIYSRPHLQGRQLFHGLLKYGEPWRLGANEATELDLYRDATIMDKKVKAGRYILYCIPQPDTWTIVINSNIDSWGLAPDTTKDLFRFTIPVKQANQHLEYFTMIFEKSDQGAELLMAWDNLEALLPFNF